MLPLQIRQLSKSYQTHSVFSQLDLEIKAGESFGLIGLNGAGKTTLLKSLLDMQPVSKGSVTWFGLPHTQKQARQQIAYLPEKFNPPDYMTGMDYLRFILDAQQLAYNDEVQASIYSLCDKLDLDSAALSQPVTALSKGMTQKLGIIGTLLPNKAFIIMDEPMSGLDPKARYCFKNIMLELRAANKTMLFCTHILNDVEQLCDRIGILHQGELRFVGTPQACCTQFKSESLEQAFLHCVEA